MEPPPAAMETVMELFNEDRERSGSIIGRGEGEEEEEEWINEMKYTISEGIYPGNHARTQVQFRTYHARNHAGVEAADA